MAALIEVGDLTGFVGVTDLDEVDTARADAAVWLADVLVRSEFGGVIDKEALPGHRFDALKAVELLVAGRLFRNRAFAAKESTGPYRIELSELLAEGWVLTETEKRQVTRAKGGRSGLGTIATTRLSSEPYAGWVSTEDGNLFPMTPLSES